jgi:hypothetical protein
MLCLVLGLLFTAAARWLLLRAGIELAVPVLTYPSLAAFATFTLWLAFFR